LKIAALKNYKCTNCDNTNLTLANTHVESIDQEIVGGLLKCKNCSASYPVKGGIPIFVLEENYTNSFGYQWNIHRKTQLDSNIGLPISRNRLFGVTGWPENMEGEVILEAGSGAGRFTEVLLGTGAEIYSFDFSSAVEANWTNNGYCSNLNLFQGDIFNIPLRRALFDKVICLGVIQHTPDPEKAFQKLTQFVKTEGELVIDVYKKGFMSLLQWKYLLRPLTKRMDKNRLYKMVSSLVPLLLPLLIFLRGTFGRVGARLLPIVEYSNLGLPHELNKEWAILDTFDMYSPAHDHPQYFNTVKRWFDEAGFVDVIVKDGPNGVVGKGRKPEKAICV